MADFIKRYWDSQAQMHAESHWSSWGDIYMINLEVEMIGHYVQSGQSVLDVGCANGYSTFQQLDKDPKSITGIDFSDEMIANAEKTRNSLDPAKARRCRFQVGDIRSLDFPDNSFDLVYTTRVLINLPTWNDQITGIRECLRVCKRGGSVVFSEAFWEPLALLNAIRALKQLPPLVEHDFNRYLKKHLLEEFLSSENLPFENVDFSSVYYIGSRFLRELVTDPTQYPGYSNPVNEAFYELERRFSGGGFGIQQGYVVRLK